MSNQKKITISIPQKVWDRAIVRMRRELEECCEIPNPEETLKSLIVDIFGNDMLDMLWEGVLDNYGEKELEGLGIKLKDEDYEDED